MSPRDNTTNEALRKKSKRKILDSAFQLFASRGYHATSIAGIAKQAQISKGLTYNYFKSKEAILEEIYKELLDEFDNMESVFKSGQPALVLSQFFDVSLNFIEERKDYFRLLSAILLQPEVFARFETRFIELYDRIVLALTAIFKELNYPEPEKEARMAAAVVDGLQFHAFFYNNKEMTRELLQFLKKKYNLSE